nr:hypothetical protein Q903MT_gene1287 [Picea sitchensis]
MPDFTQKWGIVYIYIRFFKGSRVWAYNLLIGRRLLLWDILRGDQSAVLRLSEKDKHTTSESEPRKS